MSVLQNPVRHQSFAVSARLIRWLLLWRFGFQPKSSSLPTVENPQNAEAEVTIFAWGFLPKLLSSANNFPDPAVGGVTPNKLALAGSESGQIGFWVNQNNQPNQKMKLNGKYSSITALAAALLSVATIPATADVVMTGIRFESNGEDGYGKSNNPLGRGVNISN